MAAGNVARVIRAPGRLVVTPTDLSTTYPYGGTEVGKVNQVAVLPLGAPFLVEAEGLGGVTDVLEPNARYVVSLFLRGWDDDALQLLTVGEYVAGGTTQHSGFNVPGLRTPGQSALESGNSREVTVLYVPDNLIDVPAVLIFLGIPGFTEGGELAFRRTDELGLPLSIECVRDSNGNILAIERFPDLSLT